MHPNDNHATGVDGWSAAEPDVNGVLSETPTRLTPLQRDLELAQLLRPMELLLYKAWQLDQLGAYDAIAFLDAPSDVKASIRRQAEVAVASVSPIRREEADRKTVRRVMQDLRDWAFHRTVGERDLRQIDAIQRTISDLGHSIQLTGTLQTWIRSFELELTSPLTMTEQAQAVRVALQAVRR